MGFNRKIKTMVNKIGIKDTYKESTTLNLMGTLIIMSKNR